MARPVPRVPPIWIVLLPLAVLAWMGVRAARNEADAGRSRAVARADAAAERLVRSIRAVAAEFAQGGPAAGAAQTPQEALDAVRHLFPRRLTDTAGRPLADDGSAPPAVPDAARAFAEDALEAAARLGDDAAGLEARAAFLAAAADAAPSDDAAALLRLVAAAAERELAGGLLGPDAVRAVEALAAGSPDFGDSLRERALDAIDFAGAPRVVGDLRTHWDTTRAAAREASESGAPVVRLVGRSNDLGILVVAPVTLRVVVEAGVADVAACVAGEVPSGTVQARIAREAEALAAEAALERIEVVAPDGTAPVAAARAAPETPPAVQPAAPPPTQTVEAWVALDAPLDAWRVHVVAAGDASGAAFGNVLLATVVVSALALAWGAFALRRAAAEQARLAAERQTFLDHVAHEVRTPAGALLALSEELASGAVADARRPKYHAHLVEESKRLARLVEDTLDLSRLDAGRLVLDRAPADLRAVVAEGIRAAGAEGRVVFRAPTEAVTVPVDAAAVRRVVRNLVDNALRHGAAEPPPQVTVSADARTARVVVRDAGPGIAADEVPRVFERFRRAPSETHETKGVGVGLAISREIARAHGGDVAVASEPGRGAAFTLTLPRGRGGDA